MINEILNRSFQYNGPSLEDLFKEKLDNSGLTKTQFERLSGMERRSLDAILDKTSKQTDIINQSLLIQVILLTLLVMMFGLLFNKKNKKNEF